MATSDCLYEWDFDWFIQPFKTLNHPGMTQVTVFMSESLNHSVSWFVEKKILNHPGDENKWLSLPANHRIIQLTESSKNTESFRKETSVLMQMSLNHPFIQLIHSETLIHLVTIQVKSLWDSHRVILVNGFDDSGLYTVCFNSSESAESNSTIKRVFGTIVFLILTFFFP